MILADINTKTSKPRLLKGRIMVLRECIQCRDCATRGCDCRHEYRTPTDTHTHRPLQACMCACVCEILYSRQLHILHLLKSHTQTHTERKKRKWRNDHVTYQPFVPLFHIKMSSVRSFKLVKQFRQQGNKSSWTFNCVIFPNCPATTYLCQGRICSTCLEGGQAPGKSAWDTSLWCSCTSPLLQVARCLSCLPAHRDTRHLELYCVAKETT